VSLLAWEGYTMLEVARRAGHSVQTCEKHYAKVFEDVTPDERVTAEQAIAVALEPGVAGVSRLFDVAATLWARRSEPLDDPRLSRPYCAKPETFTRDVRLLYAAR
jgi:hypothetical protein